MGRLMIFINILPSTCWINAIKWEFDIEIEGNLPHLIPTECPENKLYVPPRLQNKLITWALTGHPGTLRALELIKEKYCWPCMSKEINDYIASCSTCVQAKVPRHFPI